MRKLPFLLATLALTACVESDEGDAQFTLDVAAPSSKVLAEIGKFDGGSMPRLLGIRAPGVSNAGNGQMRVTLSGEGGQKGTILFAVASESAESSTVTVDIDLPSTVTRPDGTEMQVRGRDAANTLETALGRWAKGMSEGEAKSWQVAGVNKALTGMAVVMAPHRKAELKQILRDGKVNSYAETQAEFHGSDTPGIGWNKKDEPEGFGKPDRNGGWSDSNAGSDWGD